MPYYALPVVGKNDLLSLSLGMWGWGDDGGRFNDCDGPSQSYGMADASDNGPKPTPLTYEDPSSHGMAVG